MSQPNLLRTSWLHHAARLGSLAIVLIGLLTGIATLLGGKPRIAEAQCNIIPGVVQQRRGALGEVNRPFASPGDTVGLSLRRDVCDSASAGFTLEGNVNASFDEIAAEQVVSVIFTPNTGAKNAIVLAAPGVLGSTASCTGVASVEPRELVLGSELVVRPDKKGRRRLFFPFPETSDFNEGNGLAGPARIVVTRAGSDLHCDQSCADLAASAPAGLVACVDELFSFDGTCRTSNDDTGLLDRTFPHFTSLPPLNDYADLCEGDGAPCGAASGAPLRFATDIEGNVLIPWDFKRILIREGGVPIARIAKGRLTSEPIDVPQSFLGAYSPEGFRVPPLFTPVAGEDESLSPILFGSVDAPAGVTRIERRFGLCSDDSDQACAADADCAGGTCDTPTCPLRTPGNPVGACTADADCAGGNTCGPALFAAPPGDPGDGTGPVLVTDYALMADQAVPLAGLKSTSDLFAFVVNEEVADVGDTNLDGDSDDFVVTLADSRTGVIQDIGNVGKGQAVTRVTALSASAEQRPIEIPTVAAEGDLLAFLVPETREGNDGSGTPGLDATGDDDKSDFVLQAFRLGSDLGNLVENLELPQGVATPYLDGQALVISDGLLFFGSLEGSANAIETSLQSVDSDELHQAASTSSIATLADCAGGSPETTCERHIAFDSSLATDPGEIGGLRDILVRILPNPDDPGTIDPLDGNTVRVSIGSDGSGGFFPLLNPILDLEWTTSVVMGAAGEAPSISSTGRFVAFTANARGLGEFGDAAPGNHIYVHDRDFDGNGIFDERDEPYDPIAQNETANFRTVRITQRRVGGDGTPADPGVDQVSNILCRFANGLFVPPGFTVDLDLFWGSFQPAISPDGRFVLYQSVANNLVDGDTANDGCSPGPAEIDVTQPGDLLPLPPILGTELPNGFDLYLHDRNSNLTQNFDEPGGTTTTKITGTGDVGSFPFGGSFTSTQILPGLYRTFSLTAQSMRTNVFSEDGRFFVFETTERIDPRDDVDNCLNPFDPTASYPCPDVYLHDTMTGVSTMISAPFAPGLPVNGISLINSMTPDARLIAFTSFNSNLVPGDTNGVADVFVYDRISGEMTRESVNPIGDQGISAGGIGSGSAGLSKDGRLIAFFSDARNLVPEDNNEQIDVFHRRRDGGFITRSELKDNDRSAIPSISWSSRLDEVAFATYTSLLPEDTDVLNEDGFGPLDVYLNRSNPAVGADLNGDGDSFDGFLRIVDLAAIVNPAVEPLAVNLPASLEADVADGRLAFLALEADVGESPDAPDPPPGLARGDQDFNGDGDANDQVAHIHLGRSCGGSLCPDAENLLLPAKAVSISESVLAIISVEADENGSSVDGADQNGDGDSSDGVVHGLLLESLDDGFTVGDWSPLGAGDAVEARGNLIAFIAPESEEAPSGGGTCENGASDWSCDGDVEDRVVRIFDFSPGSPQELDVRDAEGRHPPAEELAVGPLGGRCAGAGTTSCENDSECGSGEICDGGGSCRPLGGTCQDDAGCLDEESSMSCQFGHLVAFRTRECSLCSGGNVGSSCGPAAVPDGCATASECDLNGDGDCQDDVLQTFDTAFARLRSSESTVVPCDLEACNPTVPYRVKAETVRFLLDEPAEGADRNDDGDQDDLLVNLLNVRSRELSVVAEVVRLPSGGDGVDDLIDLEVAGAQIDPLGDPPLDGPGDNSQIFLSEGFCVETDPGVACCVDSVPGPGCMGLGACELGELCVPDGPQTETGTCRRAEGTCRTSLDCSGAEQAIECAPVLAVVSANDSDGDEILDPLDNCPNVANVSQGDCDDDDVGDACDLATCGNGVVEFAGGEECDDGNLDDGDDCTRFCRIGGCFGDVNLDGRIDDADRDLFDDLAGCFPCIGEECSGACDADVGSGSDGVVNNLDALVFEQVAANDALCEPPPDLGPEEPTVCPRPPEAAEPSGVSGTEAACGFGPGIVLAVLPLWMLRRRRRA